ncbi:MAG: hypothetical protein JXA22_09620 [Candidatus Thermoplasmatota archaeon]|nr:hypothetical protein [Candidatus Thermoplasmatota archaeon]
MMKMSDNRDLKRIEAKLFSSYFQDGAWDVMIGIMMVTMALRTFIDHWTVSFLALGGVIYVFIIRKYLTVKRLGYARFSSSRKKKRVTMFLIILAANIVTLCLLIASLLGADPSFALRTTVIAALVISTFSIVAYYMDYWRFFIWGIFLTGSILVTEMFGLGPGSMVSMTMGACITIVGLYFLYIFIKKYPSSGGDRD